MDWFDTEADKEFKNKMKAMKLKSKLDDNRTYDQKQKDVAKTIAANNKKPEKKVVVTTTKTVKPKKSGLSSSEQLLESYLGRKPQDASTLLGKGFNELGKKIKTKFGGN